MKTHRRDDAALANLLTTSKKVNSVVQLGPIPDAKVTFAAEFIDGAGLVQQLEVWRKEDNAAKHPGGRPPSVSTRTVLILMFLLAIENEPLLISNMADILDHRLTPTSRRAHGFDAKGSQSEWYHRIWRAAEHIRTALDSTPTFKFQRGKRLYPDEVAELEALRRTPENQAECAKKQERLNWFSNHMLEATYQLIPVEHRRWEGNVTVDATPVAAHGKYRKPGGGRRNSSEPDAGHYVREPVLREAFADINNTDPKKRRASKHLWGWEAEYIVQTTNDPTVPADFPLIVLGIAFHKPAVASAEEALGAFRSISARGHKPGYVMADRLYFPGAKVEKLQLPLRQLGYEPVHDYKVDQLGIQDNYAGAKLVDGTWYCPSMPEALVTATTDFRDAGPRRNADGRLFYSDLDEPIDEATWRARVERRRKYALRRKEKPDEDGYYPMMCPASGPGATVACPLKPQKTGTKVAVTISIGRPPVEPDRICTNKTSVSFPPEAGVKYRQALPHGTEEWHALYSVGRNTVEGYNAYVKDQSYESLADPGRRLMRGYAAQYLLTTVLTAAANIRKITSYLTDHYRAAAGEHVVPKRRRSWKRKTTIQQWGPSQEELVGAGPPK